MANPEQVAKSKEGVKAWNEWRNCDDRDIDLNAVDLSRYKWPYRDPARHVNVPRDE
jgi:hypothetical protein